jgi:hypothetical protein
MAERGETAAFSPHDVLLLLKQIELNEETVLIGGQAVAFWHWYYSLRFPELSSATLLTSKDVDFLGTRQFARALAKAVAGHLYEPDMDDVTPNIALVVAKLGSRTIQIDVLGGVLGIRRGKERFSLMQIELLGQEIQVPLLHPVLCYITRVVNILHPAIRRNDEFARHQLDTMYDVLVCHVEEAIREGDGKEVQYCHKQILDFLRSHEQGRDAYARLNSRDVIEILKASFHDERLDKRYRILTLRNMISAIEHRRLRRRA